MKSSQCFVDDIMSVIKNTPEIMKEEMCHGDYHCYFAPDYEKMREGIEKVVLLYVPQYKELDKEMEGNGNETTSSGPSCH